MTAPRAARANESEPDGSEAASTLAPNPAPTR
jgi:hypothetical protein